MRKLIVAVVCDEHAAALLRQHPKFEVVYTAPTGTERQALDTVTADREGGGVPPATLLVDYETAASLLHLSERTVRKLVTSTWIHR